MNRKINTICFIFLFVFLISAVSAANIENETMKNIQQPDANQDLCKISVENEKIENQNVESTKEILGKSQNAAKLAAVKKNTTLTAPNIKMYYKDGSKFTVTLKNNKKAIANAKIQIKINGQTLTRTTDNKGKASIDLNYKSGTYTVLSTYNGNSEFQGNSIKSTVTIKSTIKCSDFTKYYKNTASYYSTFYDTKGRLLKNTAINFKVNTKSYSVKTNSKGVGKLNIDLKPGTYSISSINPKTSEAIAKTITIKSLIETKDLTMYYEDGSKFNVKILNSYGKVSPNKKVTLKVNGKSYTKTTDKNGIASLPINLEIGSYTITTEYANLKATNKITVNKVIKHSEFTHSVKIPSYVNVTMPYVFHNSVYSLKTGSDGIIKMPKNQYVVIQVGSKAYKFATSQTSGYDATVIGYKTYLIPFDGSGVKSELNKNNLKGNGILIYNNGDYLQIDYRDNTADNVELFGMYADKGLDGFETLTYTKNDKITAKINFQTIGFDEMGLKYSLSKFYGKTIYDINYNNIDENSVKFANTQEPVTFSMFGSYVVGYISQEDLITSFTINGKEELEKHETISYGLSKEYRKNYGFEVLQAYTIVNEKITKKIIESWISAKTKYLNRNGVMNLYGMHLASLETAWLADKFADTYSNEFSVTWKRGHTLTIMGGINLEDTYLNILNADMGMDIKGNDKNVVAFKLLNSLNLPNIEEYCLSEVSKRFMDNTTNSLENVFDAISKNKFSMSQLGEMIYIFSQDDTKSAIIVNSTDGVANVITCHDNSIYKGSSISTTKDCCGVGIMPQDMLAGIRNAMDSNSNGISNLLNYTQPLSNLAYLAAKEILKRVLSGASAVGVGLFSSMAMIQSAGTTYRDKIVNEKDWHSVMDGYTFTRPGYLQGKKVYNIPNNKGGYDYIEVKINGDMTLDRNSAKYISNGKTRQLTKDETYQYFNEEYCVPFSLPAKYWDDSWKGVMK